jgi:serine/threonine protein kinase
MCDGNIPFNSDQEICSGRINWKSHISADCRDLIQKCLMLDPKKRCSLQDILKHKWMQGPTQKLGPHNLSIKKQQLNGIGKPNPEEQDFGTTQIATTSSNAEKTIDVHQRPATSIQEKQESTIVVEKTEEKAPEFDNEENLSRASSSQEVKQDEESDESDEEDEASILERNMKVMKEDVDRLFANNNTDMPLWWKLSITQAITEDSRNNNSNIISPIERKAPGFYCQKYRGGAGSDQNLPSSILYIGTPATKVNHPSSSLYGKDRSKGNKNSSWNGRS